MQTERIEEAELQNDTHMRRDSASHNKVFDWEVKKIEVSVKDAVGKSILGSGAHAGRRRWTKYSANLFSRLAPTESQKILPARSDLLFYEYHHTYKKKCVGAIKQPNKGKAAGPHPIPLLESLNV